MLCADTQAAYGTNRKFKDFSRIAAIGEKTALSIFFNNCKFSKKHVLEK